MGTIKGQNLRLFLGGKCVAAATNATFHIAAQMGDCTTKDSEGDWTEQEPVGMSWDAQSESLVIILPGLTDNPDDAGYTVMAEGNSENEELPAMYDELIPLRPGDKIVVMNQDTYNFAAGLLAEDKATVVYSSETNSFEYTNETDEVQNVYIAGDPEVDYIIHYYVEETTGAITNEILKKMLLKAKVEVKFSTTNGTQNREEDEQLLGGYAIINDFSISAQNRENAVCTVQLAGVGELTNYTE